MRYCLSLAVLIIAVACFGTPSFGFTIAIDFEENPAPDLSEVVNVYHGDARFIYAFLVIVGPATEGPEAHIAAYDVGYRLICSGNSVTNHGFFPVREWQSLDPSDREPPANLNLPGADLPVAVGYWKLELRHGRGSHAEFQIVELPRFHGHLTTCDHAA